MLPLFDLLGALRHDFYLLNIHLHILSQTDEKQHEDEEVGETNDEEEDSGVYIHICVQVSLLLICPQDTNIFSFFFIQGKKHSISDENLQIRVVLKCNLEALTED